MKRKSLLVAMASVSLAAIGAGTVSTMAWYKVAGTVSATANDAQTVANLSINGPQDTASTLGLQFSTAIEDVTPKFNNDTPENTEDDTPKTLILSAWNSTSTSWYSQTDTNGSPKIHTLRNDETYYKIYKVTITSNYGDFGDVEKSEIDYALTNSSGSEYGKKYSCTFAGKAVSEGTITHVASCFVLDSNTMANNVAPTGVSQISFNLRDWAATSGTGALSHGTVEKYLVVYVDGTTGTHTGTVKAGIDATAAIVAI